MECTEGQISEKNASEKTARDAFAIETNTKILSLQTSGTAREPWAVERISRVRAMVTASSRDTNDPINAVFIVGKAQESRKFVLNKSLLMVSSEPFCNILAETLCKDPVWKIVDVASEQFECIVQYLFGNFTWKFVTLEATCSQIEAANRYKLKGLSDELLDKMTELIKTGKEMFNDDVVCRAWSLFTILDTKMLLAESAQIYILKNADKILRGNKFLKMLSKDLLEILIADNLAVNCELDVYKAVLKWGVHSLKEQALQITTENMRTTLSSLMPAVRFPNMTKSEVCFVFGYNLALFAVSHVLYSTQTASRDLTMFCTKLRTNDAGKVDNGRCNETLYSSM
ncbi:unnamed protein product, partial [Allacma fusca]